MAVQHVITTGQRSVPRVRVPIRTKITLPYLLLSLCLALVAAYVITQLVSENVEERFNKQLFEAGKISSELIVGYESQLLEAQRLLANVSGVSTAIRDHDPNTLRALTLGIIVNNHQDAVEFFDLQANHILSVRHRLGGNPEEYDIFSGGQTQFSNLEMVHSILERKSDNRGNKFADFVTTDFGKTLYVAGPIYTAQNDLAGVVLVGRLLPTLAQDMHTKTFAQISFYDRSGQMLYSTLPFIHHLTPEQANQAISLKDAGSAKRDLVNQRELDIANISFAEILGSWEVRGDNQLGVLGVALSETALVETSDNSRWRIFLLVASTIFLIILIGYQLANMITRPLLHLVQASKKVANGDLNIILEPQSNDEVSVLTESFNTMVASLSQSQQQLIQTYDETLEGWAKALELRDKETEGHSKRVTNLTIRLALLMGIQGETLVNIRRGALLHDIGKMGTSDTILYKKGPLSDEDWEILRKHPQDGYNLLKEIIFLGPALEIPYCHHEKWDGTGYPRQLKGSEIPLSARIFAIVDVFDAMTSDRPYRKSIPTNEVIAYLKEQSGHHFDPAVVEAFLKLLASL